MTRKIVFGVLFILVLLNVINSDIPSEEPTLISRTATTDTYRLPNGQFQKILYSGAVNMYDDNGTYHPFEDLVSMSIQGCNIVLSYGIYELQLQPYFIMQSGARYTCGDIPSEITVNPWRIQNRGNYKYGVDFYNVPDNIKNNLEYVVLHRTSVSNLVAEDFQINEGDIIIKDKIKLSHDDLLASYTLPIVNKTDVVIGNLTSNFISNLDGTWNITFDPVVKLQDASSDNLADVDYTSYDLGFSGAQIKWNITSIPSGAEIGFVTQCLYVNQETGGAVDTDVRYWRINDQSWTEASSSSTINGQSYSIQTDSTFNNSVSTDNWICFNITEVIKTDYNFSNSYSTVRFEDKDAVLTGIDTIDDVGDTTLFTFGDWDYGDEAYLRSREHATTSTRPYLIVNYITPTTPPNLTINTPLLTNYTTTTIDFNVTAIDDTKMDSCWYTLNNGTTNYTMTNLSTSDYNHTNASMAQGWFNAKFYCNDSYNNVNNTENRSFYVDSLAPTTTPSGTSPPDGASYSNDTWTGSNVEITMTAYDAGIGFDYVVYPRYCTDTTNTCNPNTFISSGTTITTEGVSYIRYFSNDTLNNVEDTKSWTIKIDTIQPNITLLGISNYTNTTDTLLDINYSVDDASSGVESCWYSNDTYSANTTLAFCANITSVTWAEGEHTVKIYVNDSVNNVNETAITFTIDTIYPQISIVYPTQNLTNSSLYDYGVNYTFTETNVDSCWWTDDWGVTNITSGICGDNLTGPWVAGINHVRIYINDSVNHVNFTDISFTIDAVKPSPRIITPSNHTNSTDTGLDVNFTFTETRPERCWWSNNSGVTNYSLGPCSLGTNITNITWNEGLNNATIYMNDSAGNENSTNVIFRIDTTAPSVNIAHPLQDASYSANSVTFNFTISDSGVGLDTCWYANHTDANVTMADCSTNLTISQGSDGTYNIALYANDTLGNEANDSVTYTISTTPPAITLEYPPTQTWTSINSVTFNYTASDSNGLDTCELWGNWSGGWHRNSSNLHGADTSVDINEGNFTLTIGDGFYKWNVWCNDTNDDSSWATGNRTIGIDTTNPLISYGGGMLSNDTNTTNNYIYVNVSVTEINDNTITFELYDRNGEVNTTLFTDSTREITWANLPDEIYSLNVTINDSAGNENSTETYVYRLDDTKPTISIAIPQAQNYGTNNSMELNYTTSDNLIGLDECWYYIQNSSGYTIKAIETLTSCENDTFTLPGGDIDYTLYLFAKDYLSNTHSASVTFGIRTVAPVIVLSPTDNTQVNNGTSLYFNFTVSTNADSIDTCELWGNWTGAWIKNQSDSTISTTSTNSFTPINLEENDSLWNVWCNDSFDNKGYALNNITFVVDLTNPSVENVSVTTTTNSQTISFDSNTADKHSTTCKYSIFDSTGAIDGLNENVSFTCNTPDISATVSAFASYNLTVYGTDLAGNENSSTKAFTTSRSLTTTTGGGSSSSATKIVTVIAIKIPPNYMNVFTVATLFSDIQRAIIYARINDYCSNYSISKKKCVFDVETKNDLISTISEYGIYLEIIELDSFVDQYNSNELDEVEVNELEANSLGLFKATLQILEEPFAVSPSRVDTFWLIINQNSTEKIIKSNKPIENCEVVVGESGWSCDAKDSYAELKYELPFFPPEFGAKNIEATISLTSKEGEVLFKDVRLRSVYLLYPTVILFTVLLVGGGTLGYVYRKKIKKKIKKLR